MLIITADDYGYRPSYDRGIVEAAGAGAVDAVSAMVERDGCDPAPLLGIGVQVGLHLELPGWRGATGSAGRAGDADRERAVTALREQLARFEELFRAPPSHLDGHHHCHAAPGLAAAIARVAAARRLRVRSVDAEHRRLLRCLGVETPDLLVGRLSGAEPVLPAELRPLIEGRGEAPVAVTEWMVHPGHADPHPGSSYDREREEDLALVRSLATDELVRAARGARRRPGDG